MKKTLIAMAIAALAAVTLFYGGVRYGRTHRSTRENLEYIWESGHSFGDGWKACEESYGIQWVNDSNGFQGWLCTRYNTNMPPGFHEMVINRSKYKP
jgi:hypothetical protein